MCSTCISSVFHLLVFLHHLTEFQLFWLSAKFHVFAAVNVFVYYMCSDFFSSLSYQKN